MPCFADINVSQGSVATCARCGGIFNMRLTANLPRNLPVKFFLNRLRFDRIMVMSPWPHFLAHPVYSWYIRDKTSSDLDDFVAHATYFYLFFLFHCREPTRAVYVVLYVAYTASRFTTTHNETPRERESPDIEALLEHSNSSEKKF